MDGRALNRKVWRDLLNLDKLEFSALRGAASESALGGRVLWTRGSKRGRWIFPQGGWADLSGSSCETKHMRMAVGREEVEEVVVVVVVVVVVMSSNTWAPLIWLLWGGSRQGSEQTTT